MHLYEIPMVFVLVGAALYAVLGGADFGAGFWQLAAGRGATAEKVRDHAHHAMAPVWEANHVWLIFVLTVFWTAYPVAFGSIASTLSLAMFIAAIGIIVRGAAYALRAGISSSRELRVIDSATALSSVLTPFALGTIAGAIASRRVPVGNASGGLFSSWTGPVSILIGVLAVASTAYLAAVYLAADAQRLGHEDLVEWFRVRALVAGLLAGAIAIGGLFVLHGEAHPLFHGLVDGDGIVPLIVSVLAGVSTLALVFGGRFGLARYTAALAVAAIIAGWALAQNPILLPGLTLRQAAAPHDALVLVIVAVLAGGAILFPSLGLLFRLVLGGGFDPGAPLDAHHHPNATSRERRTRLLARLALGCAVAGIGLLTFAEASWAHIVGIISLGGFVISAFAALEPGRDIDVIQGTAEDGECPPQAPG